jgi:hypothetical protein
MATHPFIIGEMYADRRGEYIVVEIEGRQITIQYANGTRAVGDIEIKARIYGNILAEQRFLHPLQTDGYFRFLGFLARHSEFNAEVPPQSQANFEEHYLLLTGTRPIPHSNGYFPISIQTTRDKWGPELRIYFPEPGPGFDLPPQIEIRPGNNPGIVRINNNWFWWTLVRIGFRLGTVHDVNMIRGHVPAGLRPTFEATLRLP